MSTDDTHLSIDQLADLGADAMPQAEVAAADAHLLTCQSCRAARDLLAGVPALLASVTAEPIPVEVTARVAAAIEREQIARAGDAGAPLAPDAVGAYPARLRVRRRFGARLGAGLLGATAVLGGGYLVASGLVGGSAEDNPAALGSARDEADSGTFDDGLQDPAAAEMTYGAASLEQDVQRLLTQTTSVQRGEPTPGAVLGEDGQVGEPDDVATKTCVAATQRRAGSKAVPLAVDVSTYDGTPAVVIVLPEGSSSGADALLDVWVIGTGCLSADDEDIAGVAANLEVLLHRGVRP